MQVIVPFATESPKTRLEGVLSATERREFARAMLEDVLEAVRATGHAPRVLATGPVEADVPIVIDDRPLSEAVNAQLDAHLGADGTASGVAVIMADLALATPVELAELFAESGDVVFVPGRGGGTNAFAARHPDFYVDYHGTSYLDHREIAHEIGADVSVVDSFRLSTDVDEPTDLVEVLCHGDGRARDFLVDAGFSLEMT